MPTFADHIEQKANEEPIIAVVIGDMGWPDYGDDDRHRPGLARKGQILSWDEGRPLLDYDYDSGFGAPDCQAITAWTINWVVFVVTYDGATYVEHIPRHPIVYDPPMPGGG